LDETVELFELDTASFVDELSQYGTSNLERLSGAGSGQLAYVIYTSGSTGQPKGVMVEHRHWNVYFTNACSIYQIVDSDRVLQFSSVSFDIFVEELSLSLLSGGSLFLSCSKKMPSATDFLQEVSLYEVTVVSLPTAYWQYLCDEPNTIEQFEKTALRLLITGGEVLPKKSLCKWQKRTKEALRLLNTYGPTESTVIVTYYDVTRYESVDISVPIGSALANTQLLIMSQAQKLVAKGCIGELCIGGGSVARGYLNQSEITAERFIPNPFSDDPSSRLYKTGDLVRYLPDGNLEFIGRIDDQVKIRGFRIELGEIESQLSSCAQVASSLVLAREDDEPGQKKLVAYVVAKESGYSLDDTSLVIELRRALEKSLPDYMIPSAFVVMGDWPLTANGKIDKKALPAPDGSLVQGEYVAPTTETERTLVDIWAKLLKLESQSISVTASFFELGGHSLLIIKQISQIKYDLGINLSVSQLFGLTDIRAISKVIDLLRLKLMTECSMKNSGKTIQVEF
jgi:amino acid adenylation domain-containing protein